MVRGGGFLLVLLLAAASAARALFTRPLAQPLFCAEMGPFA